MEYEERVSSKAVVKYEGPGSIASYTQLAKDTDLNRPPSNWLRDNLVGNFPFRDEKKTKPFDYSSLLMASRYPEIIGEVDVVAGANMIKKLLTMPFSSSSLSMSVQRIGNTLLLNELDIPSLLKNPYHNNSVKWLQELYCEANGIPLNSEFHPKKRNREKSELQLILSKFMYYSIEGGETSGNPQADYPNDTVYGLVTPDVQSPQSNYQSDTSYGLMTPTNQNAQGNYQSDTSYNLVTPHNQNSLANYKSDALYDLITPDARACVNDDMTQPTVTIEDDLMPNDETVIVLDTDNGKSAASSDNDQTDGFSQPVVRRTSFHKTDLSQNSSEPVGENIPSDSFYSRDVLWTFEDITMLVGSDLPIFGGGKYPAVSLRLRDSSKPINILTGIDYWLDNLMCNVPELIMCFHLKGIVQKYEKIKTSDLPDIEGSSFSQKVIKDIAQNVLSFLKANCTKEGHTYWLYRSSKDDVIKLYDLTSICRLKTGESEQDPFSVSVGVLLYNIARNMYMSGEINSRNIVKIRSLLKNCTTLLESKERADISLLANLLLIELYNDEGIHSESEDNSSAEDELESSTTDDELSESEKAGEPIKSVSVKALGYPSKMTRKIENKSDQPILVLNEETKSKNSIILMINALRSLNVLTHHEKPDSQDAKCVEKTKEEKRSSKVEVWKNKGTDDEMLRFIYNDLEFLQLHNKKKIKHLASSWDELRKIILEKIVESFVTLINITISKKKFGRALRFIQTCCYCLENAKWISMDNQYNCQLCVEILKLYGDILTIVVKKNMDAEAEQFNALNDTDYKLRTLLEYDDDTTFCGFHIKEMACRFSMSNEELMTGAAEIYENAIRRHETDHNEKNASQQIIDLSRRLGNIRNELGVLYMNKAASVSKQYGLPSEQEMALWKKSYTFYEGAIMSFKIVDDRPNMALLYMNCAKLMFLCAQVYGNSTRESVDEPRGNFTQEEKTYYNKSFEYYQKGLSALNAKDSCPAIWTSVSLELSRAYLSMAITMQEHCTVKSMEKDKVIKDISSALMKALQYSESVVNMVDEKQKVAVQGRMGSIHHRLATLYYSVFKNQVSDSGKRNYRSLSELHYKKVYEMLKPKRFPIEFLRAIIEHIDFYDYMLLHSFSWKYLKLKLDLFLPDKKSDNEKSTRLLLALQEVLDRLKSKKQKDSTHSVSSETEEFDINELRRFLNILENLMNSTLKEVIKFLSNKKQKKCDSLDIISMKKIYEIVLRGRVIKEDDVLLNVASLVRILGSIGKVYSSS